MAENTSPELKIETEVSEESISERSASKRVMRLEKAMSMYTEKLFDNNSFPNILARSYQPFYAKDKKAFKMKASEVTTIIKEEVANKIKSIVEDLQIKEKLLELDTIPAQNDSWQPTGEQDIDVKAFQYVAKLKFLSEKEHVEVEYEKLQKEFEEQLALYKSKKENLKKLSERKRLQIQEYDENISKMENMLPAEVVLNNC